MDAHRDSQLRFPYTGHILIGLAALLWSSYGAVFRGVTIPSIEFLIIRASLTIVILSPFVWSSALKQGIWEDRAFFFLCGASFTLYTFGFILTTRNIGAATAVSMQYSAPVYLFIAYILRGNRVELKRDYPKLIMVAVLIINGIWTTYRVTSLSFLLPAFMCGIGYAAFTWAVKRLSHRSPMLIVALNNVVSLMFYIPFLFLFDEPIRALSTYEILVVIFVAIFVNSLSYVIFSAGLRSVNALQASFITLIEPVMNPILVIFILKEIPPVPDLFILAVILSSLVLELIQSQKFMIQRRKVYETHI